MSIYDFIYNKYTVRFKKSNNDLTVWIYKNNKGYDSMMIYGLNIFKEFMIFVNEKELFYDEYNETFEFYIYGDDTIDNLYDDLYVFTKQFEAFIF